MIREWSRRVHGNLSLWVYTNAAWAHNNLSGVVETSPHLIADFLRAARPYIHGSFFENEAVTHTYRFFDEYMTLKLLWDPDQDVDALIGDYFINFYGPAAEPMRQFYANLERLWMTICTFFESDTVRFPGAIDVWEKIYTGKEITNLERLLQQAEIKAADNAEYRWRVNLIREWMFKHIVAKRREFMQTYGLAKQSKLTCSRAPIPADADGLLPVTAWRDARQERLDPTLGHKRLSVLTHYKTLWDDRALHLWIDCEEPDLANSNTVPGRQSDDPNLWEDNDIEVFFHSYDEGIKQDATYQLLVNDRGVTTDRVKVAGAVDWGWDSGMKIDVQRRRDGWTVRMAIPWISLGISDPLKKSVAFNLTRHRSRRDKPSEFYAWSLMKGSWHDPASYGYLEFDPNPPVAPLANLLKNGNLDEPGNGAEPLASWGTTRGNRPRVSIDKDIRWDGQGSARLQTFQRGMPTTLFQYFSHLKPNTRYRFRCKVKTKEVKPYDPGRAYRSGVHVNLSVPGAHVTLPKQGVSGTSDWRNVEFTFKTAAALGEKEPQGYVRLMLVGASGTAWFDEVELREIVNK